MPPWRSSREGPWPTPSLTCSLSFVSLSQSIVRRPPIGRMPESSGALEQGEQTVKGGACQCCNRDLGPYHVQAHAPYFRRNSKAHANDRRAEEFGDDGADQSQG